MFVVVVAAIWRYLEIILFFCWKNYDISAIFSYDFETIYTILHKMKKKRISRRPGDHFVPHPVDRKQNYFLVLPLFRAPSRLICEKKQL